MLFFHTLSNFEPKKTKLLEKLYQTQIKRMWLLSIDILKNKELAEDAVQAAFVKLTEKASLLIGFENDDKMNGYVYVVTKNMALELIRKNKKHSDEFSFDDMEYLLQDKSANTEKIILIKENLEQIQQAISTLKPLYRDILYSRYYLDLEYSEIADIFQITIEHARVRFSIGLKLARQELRRWGGSDGRSGTR